MAFKIGDKVIRIFNGATCKVIASKGNPHKTTGANGELTGETIDVPNGAEYIVVSEDELKSPRGFSPYYAVNEEELRLIENLD